MKTLIASVFSEIHRGDDGAFVMSGPTTGLTFDALPAEGPAYDVFFRIVTEPGEDVPSEPTDVSLRLLSPAGEKLSEGVAGMILSRSPTGTAAVDSVIHIPAGSGRFEHIGTYRWELVVNGNVEAYAPLDIAVRHSESRRNN